VLPGQDQAAVANRTEVLRGIETETANISDGADRHTIDRRFLSLSAVLDQGQVVLAGKCFDRADIGRMSVEVHG
jgi:hypothetical protein